MMNVSITYRVGVLSTALAALSATAAVSAQATSVRPATAYCKIVKADTIRVFDSPGGDHVVDVFSRGTAFYVDRTDAPKNRYHLNGGPNRWTTSDSDYVRSC